MNIGVYSRFRKLFAKGAPLAFAFFLMIPAIQAEEKHDHKLAVQLFQLCSACHGPQGHGNRELMAPAIAGLPEWYVVNQLKKLKRVF